MESNGDCNEIMQLRNIIYVFKGDIGVYSESNVVYRSVKKQLMSLKVE